MKRMDAIEYAASTTHLAKLDLDNLWQAYIVSRDEALRNRLLLHYLPRSRMIARHIHNRLPAGVELDDLAQAAILGLRGAIATFNPDRGIPFEHYCGPRVRGSVLDHLRSLDWAPRMLRSRVHRVKEIIQQIEMETGSAPTDEQASTALNMPLAEFRTIRGEMAGPVRINLTSNHNHGENAVNLELLPDTGTLDPLREAQRADLREFLIRGLTTVERQLVMLYYYENLSLREIGQALNLCESRVSQIHQAVIKRLRERMHRIGGATIEE